MKKIPEQLLVFAGAYIFFLFTLAENFSGPHDSITYLNGIVDGYPLVNQHHLLYHYAAYLWLQVWQFVFPSVKDYYIVEAFSALWGSASLAVVYSFFRNRFLLSKKESLFSTLVILFSYGFWFYSTNIEVYAAPMFFILLALYYLTQSHLGERHWWLVILLHCLAIVFHQVNALFTPVIVYKLWKQRKEISFFKWFSRYAITGILIVGGAYFVVGWMVEEQNSLSKWIKWMQGYAGGSVFWYPLSAKTPVDIGYGFSHALLGGHYVFHIQPLQNFMNASLASHSLADELYIARNISTSMAWFLGLLTIVLSTAILLLLTRFIRYYKAVSERYKPIVPPLLLTFGIYSLFFVFWMPEILEFWLLQTVIMWLLLLGTLRIKELPRYFKVSVVSGFLALTLFSINYLGSIRWMQHKENDLYYVKAKLVEEKVENGKDIVLMQDGWILKDFFKYFTKVPAFPVPARDSSRTSIDQKVKEVIANNGRIFILPEINNKLQAPGTEYLDSLRKVHSLQLKRIREKDPEIWVIGQ